MTNMDSGNALEVLTFSLNGQAFALEASYVREILDLVPVTEVPASSPFARGLINVRGKIVPLADLRYKLGMEERPPTIDTRVVVIEVDLDGDLTTIGLLAEKVHEVTSISAGVRWRKLRRSAWYGGTNTSAASPSATMTSSSSSISPPSLHRLCKPDRKQVAFTPVKGARRSPSGS